MRSPDSWQLPPIHFSLTPNEGQPEEIGRRQKTRCTSFLASQAALAAGLGKRQSGNWKASPNHLIKHIQTSPWGPADWLHTPRKRLSPHKTRLLHCTFEIQLGQTGHGRGAEVNFLPGAVGFKVNSCYIWESTLGNSLLHHSSLFFWPCKIQTIVAIYCTLTARQALKAPSGPSWYWILCTATAI